MGSIAKVKEGETTLSLLHVNTSYTLSFHGFNLFLQAKSEQCHCVSEKFFIATYGHVNIP